MKYLLLIVVALMVSCINSEKDNSINLLTAEELQLNDHWVLKDGMLYPPIPEEEEGRTALNIMYDKRVFRGNTHNQNILK